MRPRTAVVLVGLCALLTVTAFEGTATTYDELVEADAGNSEKEVAKLMKKAKGELSDVQGEVKKVSNKVAKGTFMAMMASKEVKDAKFLLDTTKAAVKHAEKQTAKFAKAAAKTAVRKAKAKVTAMERLAKAKARMVEHAELQSHNKSAAVTAAAKKLYSQTYAKNLKGQAAAQKVAAQAPIVAAAAEKRAIGRAEKLGQKKLKLAQMSVNATDKSALAARAEALKLAKAAEKRELGELKSADETVVALKEKVGLMDTSANVDEAQMKAAKEVVEKKRLSIEHMQRLAVQAKQKEARRAARVATGSGRAVSFAKKLKSARQDAHKAAQAVRHAQEEAKAKAYKHAQIVRAHIISQIKKLKKAANQQLKLSEKQLHKAKLTAETQHAALNAGVHAIGESTAIKIAKTKVIKAAQWQKAKSIKVPHVNATVHSLKAGIEKLTTKAKSLKNSASSKGLVKKAFGKAAARSAQQKKAVAQTVVRAKKEMIAKTAAAAKKAAAAALKRAFGKSAAKSSQQKKAVAQTVVRAKKMAAKTAAAGKKAAAAAKKVAKVKAAAKKAVTTANGKGSKSGAKAKAVAPVVHLEINDAAKSVNRAVQKARRDFSRVQAGHESVRHMRDHMKNLNAIMHAAEHEYEDAKSDVSGHK